MTTKAQRELRLFVLERDGYVCAYCGSRATEMDHILPKSEGRRAGIKRDNAGYIVSACHDCNGRKGTRRIAPVSWPVERVAALADLTGRPWLRWDGDPAKLSVVLR